jgi:hypothetical protein
MIDRAFELVRSVLDGHDQRLKRLEANQTITVIVKTDTGNPTTIGDGILVINTFDNTVNLYADGGWRQLASW